MNPCNAGLAAGSRTRATDGIDGPSIPDAGCALATGPPCVPDSGGAPRCPDLT
jgi:hypothetical protein